MFRSVKLKNLRLTVFCLICALLFAAVCFSALGVGSSDTVRLHGEPYTLKTETEEDIGSFLAACGYENPELLLEEEITVPKHWNDVYTAYNELQRSQGFDLVPYKGKKAVQYVYSVSQERNAAVLISANRIIAAHCCGTDGGALRRAIEEPESR